MMLDNAKAGSACCVIIFYLTTYSLISLITQQTFLFILGEIRSYLIGLSREIFGQNVSSTRNFANHF